MSDLLNQRVLAVTLVAIFGVSVYLSITLSQDRADADDIEQQPAAQVVEKPKPQINNVIEYRISEKLMINTATVGQIYTRLDGIGPKIAQQIVDHRNKYGPFKSFEELEAVKGIGPAKINANKHDISFTIKDKKLKDN